MGTLCKNHHFQNRTSVEIFFNTGTVSQVTRFAYKRNEFHIILGPETSISSGNVTPFATQKSGQTEKPWIRILPPYARPGRKDAPFGSGFTPPPHSNKQLKQLNSNRDRECARIAVPPRENSNPGMHNNHTNKHNTTPIQTTQTQTQTQTGTGNVPG